MAVPDFRCSPLLSNTTADDVNGTGAPPAARQERVNAGRFDAATRLATQEPLLQVDHGESQIQPGEQAASGDLPLLRSFGRDGNDRSTSRLSSLPLSLEAAAERFVTRGWPDRQRITPDEAAATLAADTAALLADLPCSKCGHRSHAGQCPCDSEDDAGECCSCGGTR